MEDNLKRGKHPHILQNNIEVLTLFIFKNKMIREILFKDTAKKLENCLCYFKAFVRIPAVDDDSVRTETCSNTK